MNLTLAGHHLHITPAIREYVTTKLERVSRHFDDLMDVNVVLSVEKKKKKIEANIHVRGKELFVEAEDGTSTPHRFVCRKLDRKSSSTKRRSSSRATTMR